MNKFAVFCGLALLLLSGTVSSQSTSPYCTVQTPNVNVFLSQETMIGFSETYIQGYNMTYQIEAAKGSSVSTTQTFSILGNSSSVLNSIVSTSALSTINNQITYSLLESVATGGYNVYVSTQSSFTTAPSFNGNAITNLTMDGQTCNSITSVGLGQAVVGCYINFNGALSNIFYIINNGTLVGNANFGNWDPTWGSINYQKVVAFSLGSGLSNVFLAVITPSANIMPASNTTAVNNFVDIYVFNTANLTLTPQTRILAQNFKTPSNVTTFSINDIAVSGDTVFLLANNYVFPFNNIPNSNPTTNNWVLNQYFLVKPAMAMKIAAYQTGATTYVAISNPLTIELWEYLSSSSYYIVGTFYNQQLISGIQSLFLTAQYVAIQLNSIVYVYPINKRNQVQDQYYQLGNPAGANNFIFTLLLNDYAFIAYPNYFATYSLQDPIFQITNPLNSDTITLTGKSNANNSVTSCVVTFAATQIGTNSSNWGVYTTNMAQNTDVSLTYSSNFNFNPSSYFTGWNLNYSMNNTGNNTWNTNFTTNGPNQTTTTLSNVSNPIYLQTYSNDYLDQNGLYYIFTQTSGFLMSVQLCPSNGGSACSSLFTYQLNSTITGLANTQYYFSNGTSVYITVVSYNTSISVFTSNNNVFSYLSSFSLPGPCSDVQFVGSTLAVVTSNTDVDLLLLTLTNSNTNPLDITQIYSIDATTAAQWTGASAPWAPVNVHSSNVFSNRLVVECLNGIFVLGFNYQFLEPFFLSFIPTQSTIGGANVWNRSVTVYDNYLTILEANSTSFSQITEFALFSVFNPLQTQSFVLPNNITFPLVSTFGSGSKLLYFVGSSMGANSVFAYSVGSVAADAIYVAPTIPFAPTAGSLLLSVSSAPLNKTDTVVLIASNNNQIVSWNIPQIPIISVISLYNSPNDQLVQSFSANLTASSNFAPSTNNMAGVSYTINILNSQEVISSINTNSVIQIAGSIGSIAFINGSEYFNGTVFDYSIASNISNSLTISNKLRSISTNNPLNGIPSLTAQRMYQQYLFTLSFNGQMNVIDILNDSTVYKINVASSNYVCSQLTLTMPNYNNQTTLVYAYAPCLNTITGQWIVTIGTFDTSAPSNSADHYDIILPGVSNVKNFYAQSPLSYILLDASPSLKNYASGQVKTFSVQPPLGNGAQANLTSSFGNGLCGLNISNNFVFAGYGFTNQSQINIFLLDNSKNFLYLVPINNATQTCVGTASGINLNSFLAQSGVFVPTGTAFNEFYIVNSNITQNQTFYTILLLSPYAPIYQINFYADASNNLFTGGVSTIYNSYPGTRLAASSFSHSRGVDYFSVNYMNQTGNQLITAIYNFKSAIFSQLPSNITTYLQPISAVIYGDGANYQNFFPQIAWLQVMPYPGPPVPIYKIFYYNSLQSSYDLYYYSSYLMLNVTGPLPSGNTYVGIFAQNPVSSTTNYIPLNVTVNNINSTSPVPIPFINPTTPTAYWYWVVIACIIFLLAVGVIFLLAFRTRKTEAQAARQYLVEDA